MNHNILLFLNLFWTLLYHSEECNNVDVMSILPKIFDIRQPTIAVYFKENQVQMLKSFSNQDTLAKTKEDYDQVSAGDEVIALFKEDNESEAVKNVGNIFKKGILIFDNNFTLHNTADKLNFGINQEIYLFDCNSFELYETYNINNIKKVSKLGYLSTSVEGKFIWEIGVNPR